MEKVEEFAAWSTRKSEFLGIREMNGWPLKAYAIHSSETSDTHAEVLEQAVEFARREARFPEQVHWPAGFLIIHFGQDANWLLVDAWANEILWHSLYASPLDSETGFAKVSNSAICACVWELEIIEHERRAWVKHVLAKPTAASIDAYLGDVIEIEAGKQLDGAEKSQ